MGVIAKFLSWVRGPEPLPEQRAWDDEDFLLWLNLQRDGAPITLKMAKADSFYAYHRKMFKMARGG